MQAPRIREPKPSIFNPRISNGAFLAFLLAAFLSPITAMASNESSPPAEVTVLHEGNPAPQKTSPQMPPLQLWHQMMYEHRRVLAEVLQEFERAHPGESVRAMYRETETLRSSFQTAAMGGSGPDLIFGPSDQIGPLATMGLLAPLDQVLEETLWEDLDPLAKPRFSPRPGLPEQRYFAGASVGNFLMLFYNRKLVAKPPQNTRELVEMSRRLVSQGRWGLVLNLPEPFFVAPFAAGFGQSFLSSAGDPQLNTPALQRTLEFFRFLREQKLMPQEVDYEIANALFKQDRAGFLINGDWSWGDYKKAGIDFGIAPLPMISPEHNSGLAGSWPAPLVASTGYSMNANLQDPTRLARVTQLLAYLLSPAVQLRFHQAVSTLPSSQMARSKILQSQAIANSKEKIFFEKAIEIMAKGEPMPVRPQMRAIWDAFRKHLQATLAGDDIVASTEMAQAEALAQMERMTESLRPGAESNWIKAAFWLVLALALGYAIWKSPGILRGIRRKPFFWVMIAPGMVAALLMVAIPFFYNLLLSLSNFSLMNFRHWEIIGWHHYLDVLTDPQLLPLLLKSVIWTVANVTLHVGIGTTLAILIHQIMPAKPLWRILLILPWAMPQYLAALTWRAMFQQEYGPINQFLTEWLQLSPVQWLSQPFTAFFACLVTNVWLGFPFMMVVALGGLQSISPSLYEAARMDGANTWQRLRYITLPNLLPVLGPAAVLGAVWTFNNLHVIWLVSGGGQPADQTHILVSYVYKSGFFLYRYSYAAALSMVIFALLLTYLLAIRFWQKRKALRGSS